MKYAKSAERRTRRKFAESTSFPFMDFYPGCVRVNFPFPGTRTIFGNERRPRTNGMQTTIRNWMERLQLFGMERSPSATCRDLTRRVPKRISLPVGLEQIVITRTRPNYEPEFSRLKRSSLKEPLQRYVIRVPGTFFIEEHA